MSKKKDSWKSFVVFVRLFACLFVFVSRLVGTFIRKTTRSLVATARLCSTRSGVFWASIIPPIFPSTTPESGVVECDISLLREEEVCGKGFSVPTPPKDEEEGEGGSPAEALAASRACSWASEMIMGLLLPLPRPLPLPPPLFPFSLLLSLAAVAIGGGGAAAAGGCEHQTMQR